MSSQDPQYIDHEEHAAQLAQFAEDAREEREERATITTREAGEIVARYPNDPTQGVGRDR